MVNRIVIIGETGQVARNLKKILGEEAICLGRDKLDLVSNNIVEVLSQYKPSIIINAAAYTQVDKAEEEQEIAKIINGNAVGIISEYAKKNNIFLVHYSTDYIFKGSIKDKNIEEEETPFPLSSYGRSKLLGEENIKLVAPKYLIIRTSAVYDSEGHNFVKTMLKLGKSNKEIRVVSDQFTSPTYAFDLADATIKIIRKIDDNYKSDIYNIVNNGSTSWYDFALNIFELAKKYEMNIDLKSVMPISSSEYPTLAKRPQYSVLSCNKLYRNFTITMPAWKEALERCIKEISKEEYENH